MKLQQYFQAYEFDEIYPYIGLMYPKARHQRSQFEHAFEILKSMKLVPSKKQIRYQLMEDPNSKEVFFGADDTNFNGTWEVLLGKEVKKEPKVDLTPEEMLANMLLNVVLFGRHPHSFDNDYNIIVK